MNNSRDANRIFSYCVHHPVFSHILLILVLSIGLVGIANIKTQLIPNLAIPQLYTNFFWPGADSSQVENNIVIPAEDAIQNLDGLEDIVSVSRAASATIILKFEQSQNMQDARQKAIQELDRTSFPRQMEDYTLSIIEPKELTARISFKAPESKIDEISRSIESSLNRYQIKSTQIFGVPDYELQLEINPTWLQNHAITANQLATAIQQMLSSAPTGFAGDDGQYAASEVGIPVQDILDLNWKIKLPGDSSLTDAHTIFSTAKLVNAENQVQYFSDQQSLAEIRVFRNAQEDLISIATNLNKWVNDHQAEYAELDLQIYSQTWKYFVDRMMLIIKNGGAGLILILGLLSFFLNNRYAAWVAAGLPISILGTIALLYLLGFHINMISMFAIILSLGIIVDDAIVVAEQAESLRHQFKAEHACTLAATQMLKPVMTSSMTTLAAFFPLLFISGVAGQFLKEIPIVVITVIIASLIECFLILPKHLSMIQSQPKISRSSIYFRHFRIHRFLPLIRFTIHNRWVVICSALCFIFITFSLLATQRIQFSFFPNFSSEQVTLEVGFDSTATYDEKQAYLFDLEQSLIKTTQAYNEEIVDHHHIIMNQSLDERVTANPITDGIHIWLTDQDKRSTQNDDFVQDLRKNAPQSPIVNILAIDQPRGGGPASDEIQIKLIGTHENLIAAADELKGALRTFQGLYDIDDDSASTTPNHFYELKDLAIFSGLNTQALQYQIKSYLNTQRNWSFNIDGQEVDLVILMPKKSKAYQAQIDEIPVQVTPKTILPLSEITEKITKYIPQLLIRKNQVRTYTVTAKVNTDVTNTYAVDAELNAKTLPAIAAKHKVTTSIGDIRKDQNKTLGELKAGAIIGASVIYLILAWSLSSFMQPIAILLTLPLALTGGILGHWLLGFDITLLSLFGFFGLAGVTVNDSIILSLKYQELKKRMPINNALIGASYKRFRAVILTSLTTIGGLLPLMFETSFQAQFIIPMAITIAFGLLFGTCWILIFLPAILSLTTSED